MNKQITLLYRGDRISIALNQEGYLDRGSRNLLEDLFPGSTSRPGGEMPGVVLPWIQKHHDVTVEDESGKQNELSNLEVIPLVKQILVQFCLQKPDEISLRDGKEEVDVVAKFTDGEKVLIRFPAQMKRAVVARVKLLAGISLTEVSPLLQGTIPFDDFAKGYQIKTSITRQGALENLILQAK